MLPVCQVFPFNGSYCANKKELQNLTSVTLSFLCGNYWIRTSDPPAEAGCAEPAELSSRLKQKKSQILI